MPTYLLVMAHLDPTRVRYVPATAIVEQGENGDVGDYALLQCPCGSRPVVTDGLSQCVGCERYYVTVSACVYVVYGAMKPPPLRRARPLLAPGP
jgi:hypothetical protein